jgi:PIN domain nuclease of toxin-antitoxin system
MNLLIDTHVALWFLCAPERLSEKIRSLLDRETAAGRKVGLSAVSVIELVNLVDKRQLEVEVLEQVLDALDRSDGPFEPVPLTAEMAVSLLAIPEVTVPNMTDRIIAATARHHGVPLVSKDERIRQLDPSIVQVIW